MAASDASADPDTKTAALGGWFHFGSSPKQDQVRWFYKSINIQEHPWAFKKRRRQNSRRKNGHRQFETTLRIVDIKVA